MSAQKAKLVQNRLDRVGSKDQTYVLIGNTAKAIQSDDTIQSDGTLWTDSEIAYRVSRNDVVAVVTNYTWSRSNIYVPWSSQEINTGKFYAYNKSNGIVYLCITNNTLNRKDLIYSNVSTQIPSHEFGSQTYSDGYSWLALYKITPSLLRFVNTNWLPVVSLNDYAENEFATKYSEISNFCDGSPGNTGNCGVYFKENTIIPTGEETSITYTKGDLYSTLTNLTCSECYNLFSDNESNFVSDYFGTNTPTETISIKTTLEKIKELIDNNTISTASPYYWLYQAQVNGPKDGSIVSCFIDLSNYATSQLFVTQENPLLPITSSTGVDGVIRLKTYKNSAKKIVINGIEVVNGGSDYKDYRLSIPSGLLEEGSISEELLLSSITVNIDFVDLLGADPVTTLGASNILTNARINLEEIKASEITLPEKINFYGIVVNPLERESTKTINPQTGSQTDVKEVVAGQTLSRFKSTTLTNNIKVNVLTVPTETIDVGSEIVLESSLVEEIKTDNAKIAAIENTTKYEITAVNEKNLVELDVLVINEEKISVDTYELPPLVQYSGKIASSKKINDIPLGNLSNTKIINITSISSI
jgi:hypothetical protein